MDIVPRGFFTLAIGKAMYSGVEMVVIAPRENASFGLDNWAAFFYFMDDVEDGTLLIIRRFTDQNSSVLYATDPPQNHPIKLVAGAVPIDEKRVGLLSEDEITQAYSVDNVTRNSIVPGGDVNFISGKSMLNILLAAIPQLQ